MAKGAKRRRQELSLTHDEVSGYNDTSSLFKSNLFKLQTAELLSVLCPDGRYTHTHTHTFHHSFHHSIH